MEGDNKTNALVAGGAFPERIISPNVIRDFNPNRGKRVLEVFGYDNDSSLVQEYSALLSLKAKKGDIPAKKKAVFVAKFILQTFEVLKLSEVGVFYIGYAGEPLFRKCQSTEELTSCVSYWYQMFFGLSQDIDDCTKILVSSLLPEDLYPEVQRDYIQVSKNLVWYREDTNVLNKGELEKGTRVLAKMFDTAYEDANIFKVPEFDREDEKKVLRVYDELKEISYYDWPDEYHFQCFKDWSMNRRDVEFGMFSVLALPFMRPTIMRGSIFNVGEGHNGKSVLVGLATSLIGGRNTTQVSGNDLGKWDFLVDLQTTWFNCPSETELEFLKENTGAFKTLSAHETLSIRKKHGDASVPVKGAFPMVFNINKIPDFGADAPAILSRMFINNFDVDFEAEGKAVKDYAKKTFLSDKSTMPTLTGMVFAFAHYYSQPEHLWQPSASMRDELLALTDIATPQKRYVEWFKFFFCGYTGVNIIKTDYSNFGAQEGEDYNTSEITQKSLLFKQFKMHNYAIGVVYTLDDGPYPVERFIFSKDLYIRKYMGSMTMEEYRDGGHSLVYDMMLDYLGKEQIVRDTLRKRGESERSKEEIKKMVLQQMFKEIGELQKGAPYERKRSC